jgi:amidase
MKLDLLSTGGVPWISAFVQSPRSLECFAREVTPLEVTRSLLDRTDAADGVLGSYVAVCADRATEQARDADRMFDAGAAPAPLCGVPIAVEHIINTNGIATSCGTASLRNWEPDHDAAVVDIFGKPVPCLWASSLPSSLRHPATPKNASAKQSMGTRLLVGRILEWVGRGHRRRPVLWRHRNGLRWLHRIPSAMCGLAGLKPSHSRVSRFGVYPLCETLDTIGPMVRSAEDAALMFAAIARPDDLDSMSAETAGPVSSFRSAKGLRIGIASDRMELLDQSAKHAIQTAISALTDAGAIAVEIALAGCEAIGRHFLRLTAVEAAQAHLEISADAHSLRGLSVYFNSWALLSSSTCRKSCSAVPHAFATSHQVQAGPCSSKNPDKSVRQ